MLQLCVVLPLLFGQTPELAPVLFPANAAWNMGNLSGPKSDLVVANVDGQPAFRVGTSGLVLTSKDKFTGDVEIRLRVRMTAPDDKGCYFTIVPGLPAPDKV